MIIIQYMQSQFLAVNDIRVLKTFLVSVDITLVKLKGTTISQHKTMVIKAIIHRSNRQTIHASLSCIPSLHLHNSSSHLAFDANCRSLSELPLPC